MAELLRLIEAAEFAQLGNCLKLEIHAIGMRGRCRTEGFECRGSITTLSRNLPELDQSVGVMRIYRQGVPAQGFRFIEPPHELQFRCEAGPSSWVSRIDFHGRLKRR